MLSFFKAFQCIRRNMGIASQCYLKVNLVIFYLYRG